MKKAACIFVLLVILTSIPISFSTPPSVFDRYFIDATLYPEKRIVSGVLRVEYHNKGTDPLSEVYFHVYPNAPSFRSSGGYLKVKEVLVNGGEARYEICGEDGTALKVNLEAPLQPRDSVLVEIRFETRVPIKEDRFGYYEGIFALGQWYPILAVYDWRGWNIDPYIDEGESFYFECAYYNVTFRVPPGYVMASTGVLKNLVKGEDSWVYYWYTPLPVREYACAISKLYVVAEGEAEVEGRKVKVYSYYLKEDEIPGRIALDAAIKSIELYSKLYGPYVYPELRVVEVHGWFGGMEYPMFVMITSRIYDPRRRELLELVVSHEVSHNWWYGMVGNHAGREPFLDEAFAEYSDTLYFEFIYGKKKFKEVFSRYVRRPYYRFLERRGRDYSLSSSIFDFGSDSYAYFNVIYNKGAMVLNMLRYLMGDEKFFEFTKKLQREYRFGIITLDDFKRCAEEIYGADLDWFFESWIRGEGLPTYRVEAEARPVGFSYYVSIYVENLGYPVTARVPVEIRTKLVSLTVDVWVNGSEGSASVLVPFEPLWVVVDPEDIVPGEDYDEPVPVKLGFHTRIEEELLVTSFILFFAVVNLVQDRRRKSGDNVARSVPR